MARAAANSLGTITNLEKMAFLKVSYGALFMVKRESQTENGQKIFTLVPSTIGWHIPFLYTGV